MSFRNHITGSMMSLHTALDGKIVRLPRITHTSSSASPIVPIPGNRSGAGSNELWLTPGTSHMGLEGVHPGESTSTTPYATRQGRLEGVQHGESTSTSPYVTRLGHDTHTPSEHSVSPSYTHDLPENASPYSRHIPVDDGTYEEMGEVTMYHGEDDMGYPGEVYHRNSGSHIVSPESTLLRAGSSSASTDSHHHHWRQKPVSTVYAPSLRLPRLVSQEYSSPRKTERSPSNRGGGIYAPRMSELSRSRIGSAGTDYASPARRRNRKNSRSKSESAATPGSSKDKALRDVSQRSRRNSGDSRSLHSEDATYH